MLLLVYIYAEKNVLLISSGYWIDWKNFFFYIVYLSCLSLVSPSQRSLTHQNKITNICRVNNRQQKSKKQIVAIVIILSCRCWHCSCYTNRNLDVIVTTASSYEEKFITDSTSRAYTILSN